jgi:hypothetical protein
LRLLLVVHEATSPASSRSTRSLPASSDSDAGAERRGASDPFADPFASDDGAAPHDAASAAD